MSTQGIIFVMVSGQMWNQIRGPPFAHRNPQTGETVSLVAAPSAVHSAMMCLFVHIAVCTVCVVYCKIYMSMYVWCTVCTSMHVYNMRCMF